MMICYDVNAHNLKTKRMRRGFTLVELLIVIVVIGILSAMMIISASEVMASARANNVIVALRQWKTATLEWYMNNIDRVIEHGKVKDKDNNEQEFASGVISTMEIAKYLNGDFEATGKFQSGAEGAKDRNSGGRYYVDHLKVEGNDKYYKWYICYFMPNDHDTRLFQKLEGRAASAGLWSKNPGNGFGGKYTATGGEKGNNNKPYCVAIEVINFSDK